MSEMLPPTDPPYPPPPPPPVVDAIPWERPSAGLGAIFPTMGRFIMSPLSAFARMSLTVDLVRPIAYYVVMVLIGQIFAQIWQAIFFDQTVEMLQRFLPPELAQQLAPLLHRPGLVQIVLTLVAFPIVFLILLLIWAALVHGGLVVLGGAASGFSATLRVLCYARTTDLAMAVPMVGGLVAFVWRRILEAIGLSTAHKCEPWKAVIAVLLPMILCCACIAVGAFAFAGLIARALNI